MAASKREELLRRKSLEKLRRQSSRKLSKLKESAKEDARRAVHLAAKRALESANGSNDFESSGSYLDASGRERLPSLDLSHNSSSSTERAIRRGSRLGLIENNEFPVHGDTSFAGSFDFELTTVSETRMSSLSEIKQRKAKWVFLQSKKPKKKAGFLTSEITQEAWMCGVCGKSFSSWDAAEKHEDYHIKEVVMDLGWMADNNLSNSSFPFTPTSAAPEPPQTPDEKSNLHQLHFRTPAATVQSRPDVLRKLDASSFRTPVGSTQPKPDVLRKSAANLSTSRVQFQTDAIAYSQTMTSPERDTSTSSMDDLLADRAIVQTPVRKPIIKQPSKMSATNENLDISEHDLLVPQGVREYVVLADEALVDVCLKAQSMILTRSEMEAEIELEWLAKDKAYYELLYERQLERHRSGAYSRFRTEGKTLLSKVQNKFVDAYQLMKEGNSKGKISVMDHYTRRVKGDLDAQVVIDHNKKTLYVNVIVKNSIQVVSHELERLAKQRWVEQQKGSKDGKDDQAERFQRFRAAAQGNLVKLAGLALASDFTPRRIAVQLSNDLYR